MTDSQAAEVRAFMENFVAMLKGEAETCLRCGAKINSLEEVGRCVYARPCGCRQYQGKAPMKQRG